MSNVTTRCPNCRKAYKVPEAQLGHKARCKNCSHKFTVVVAAEETASPRPASDEGSGGALVDSAESPAQSPASAGSRARHTFTPVARSRGTDPLMDAVKSFFRAIDRLLRRLVGDENDILRYFLWAVLPLLLGAAVWTMLALSPLPASQSARDESKPTPTGTYVPIASASKPPRPTGYVVQPGESATKPTSAAPQVADSATVPPRPTGSAVKTPPPPQDHPKEIAVDLGDGVKLRMILIPAGEFLMGSPDSDKDAFDGEHPQHRVRITKPFYLGKYPVTQEQWQAVMGNNPSYFKGPKNPVEQVSWDDCQEFLKKLNAKLGSLHPGNLPEGAGEFRLPTEAQWEYACRAGSTTRYCFGDDESTLGDYAWYNANSGSTTHPVGEKKPNAWGLCDMHGNVWQWCRDWYGGYADSGTDDPTGPATGSYRVLRGGGWSGGAGFCRSAGRGGYSPVIRCRDLGFRVSRVPAE